MQEALQSAQSLAANSNHTEFDNEHFLIALLEQRAPPFALDVCLQQYAVMTEVVSRPKPAVNLG